MNNADAVPAATKNTASFTKEAAVVTRVNIFPW